jgi:hypothetical protein
MTIILAHQRALPRSRSKMRRAAEAAGVRRWLYVGDDSAWLLRAERTLLRDFPRVGAGGTLGRLAYDLRRPYIDWIGELSQGNASLEWWASELAARNPYMMLYMRICAAAAARELLGADREPALVVCSTPALAGSVESHARAAGIPVRELRHRRLLSSPPQPAAERVMMRVGRTGLDSWSRVAPARVRGLPGRMSEQVRAALDGTPRHRRRVLREHGVRPTGEFHGEDTVLLVTWVDDRSFASDGSYRDPFFGPLPALLRERGHKVAWLPRILPAASYEACVKRLVETGERVFFPDHWVTAADWRACATRASRFSPAIPDDSTVGGVPVEALAREHVAEQWRAHIASLSYEPLVRNLAQARVQPRILIHPYEGHSWEQALTWSIRRHSPGTKVVGYDLSNFSRLLTSLFPARAEIGLRPLPDTLVTGGGAFRRLLIEEGFPEESVREGCALRHAYVHERLEASPVRPPGGGSRRLLVATGIGFAESVELVEKAVQAFGSDPGYEITVKCHPAVDPDRVRSYVSATAEVERVHFSDRPIEGLLSSADLMLYTYTSTCYEALAHGVPPVYVAPENFVPIDKLEPFPDVGWRAQTVSQLRLAAEEIAVLSGPRRQEWEHRAHAAVREAFGPVTGDCVEAFVA